MIAPMVIAKNEYIRIFIIATIFSVLGGIFGYILGAYFFDLAKIIMVFMIMKKIFFYKEYNNTRRGFLCLVDNIIFSRFYPTTLKVFTIMRFN